MSAAAFLMAATALALPGAAAAGPVPYYVSSSCGSDANDGLAGARSGQHGPWTSLARIGRASLRRGDRVLLRCGDTWREPLTLATNGTSAEPLTLGAYGTGPRPRLLGDGSTGSACITLQGCAGWRIDGLELAHAQHAVRVRPDSRVRPEYDLLEISRCFVHDIQNPMFPTRSGERGRSTSTCAIWATPS